MGEGFSGYRSAEDFGEKGEPESAPDGQKNEGLPLAESAIEESVGADEVVIEEPVLPESDGEAGTYWTPERISDSVRRFWKSRLALERRQMLEEKQRGCWL